MEKVFTRDFPHRQCHEGAMLGNGWLGLYVWGEGRALKLTLGCANLWDHRGGLTWSAKQNYTDIRKALEAGDEAAIKAMFYTNMETQPGQPARPSIIPLGRVELTLPEDAELVSTIADYSTGLVTATYERTVGSCQVDFRLDMTDKGSFGIRCDEPLPLRVVSSYELSGSALSSISFPAPTTLDTDDLQGFMQLMPVDDPYALCVRRAGNIVAGRFRREADPAALRENVKTATMFDWEAVTAANTAWWTSFWSDVPEISLANKDIEALYSEGMARFGMMTAADGVPAGLQGPWIEDHKLPPWSSDFHFNINVQMCYWPAYRGNLCRNLLPLFRLVGSWRPQMRENARLYIGIDNGYMLPHSVDDHCVCMGGFWTGAIDNACGAWMAQMMGDYVDYTDDVEFLRELGYDFMQGVFNVFYAMLEWQNGHLVLPVSVSPEYRGADMNAWGANASFQLAALHRLTRELKTAARRLNAEADPRWDEVANYLPQAALVPCGKGQEIALWEGLALEESHRHHSHLGGICPFDTIDPEDSAWRDIVTNSLRRWTRLGMGMWSGWCMPWAAMLYCRMSNGRMAETILEIWRRVFVNPGGGTNHDPDFAGFSNLGFTSREIMQMDASMGSVTAIQDMLLHSRQDTLHVFAGINPYWKEARFAKMPAPGGFIVTAERDTRKNMAVLVSATRDNHLRLVVHDSRPLVGRLDGQIVRPVNGVFECDLVAGHSLHITAEVK